MTERNTSKKNTPWPMLSFIVNLSRFIVTVIYSHTDTNS